MDLVPLPKARIWKGKGDFFRPFRNAAAEAGESIVPLYDPSAHHVEAPEPDLRELNVALAALVEIFPQVEPEVFREMLLSVSPESRLQIVTEQLLSKKARLRPIRLRPPQKAKCDSSKGRLSGRQPGTDTALRAEETFRGDVYKRAAMQVLYEEFRALNHSAIKAVLAEHNFSYTLSRPVLQQLSTISWRFTLSSLWTRRSTLAPAPSQDHPFVVWQPASDHDRYFAPSIRRTGSVQLDLELYELFVAPIVASKRQRQLEEDRTLASQLNALEAEAAEALFECECCYSATTFEAIATCTDGCHQLCFDCVRRTVSEALFGQGWSRAVDLERSTLRCFAPTAVECQGIIPPDILRRALTSMNEKEDLWSDLQERAAGEVLLKSRLPLQRCPFCNYAEVDETPCPRRRKSMEIWHHISTRTSGAFQALALSIMAALLILTVPVVMVASFVWLAMTVYPPAASLLKASWTRVHRKRRGLKFQCRHPRCRSVTCVRCLTHWRDPHVCFENEKTSLRTAIESSATAVVKRTCPRCLLSFVKSSGCNKIVCNCGYALCFICRQEITSKEGYGHFCQHFRPNGGRCPECDRCDLYGDEDEEAAIRQAVEEAEKMWREKEGSRDGDTRTTQAMVDALVGQTRATRYWERWLDMTVDVLVA